MLHRELRLERSQAVRAPGRGAGGAQPQAKMLPAHPGGRWSPYWRTNPWGKGSVVLWDTEQVGMVPLSPYRAGASSLGHPAAAPASQLVSPTRGFKCLSSLIPNKWERDVEQTSSKCLCWGALGWVLLSLKPEAKSTGDRGAKILPG